jgi:hypothetical protein
MEIYEMPNGRTNPELFRSLKLAEWEATKDTLHLWTQIVGKIRLVQTPLVNHFWNVTLYVSARGLTTSPMRYDKGLFEIEFDFIDHKLVFKTSLGETKTIRLEPKSVAQFYEEVIETLRSIGIGCEIRAIPDEIPNAIPFNQDETHKSYDPVYAHRFWQALILVDKVFSEFRCRFIGKVSPVHFFWGSFDLAVTRFNGELAPKRENADAITRKPIRTRLLVMAFGWVATAWKRHSTPMLHRNPKALRLLLLDRKKHFIVRK